MVLLPIPSTSEDFPKSTLTFDADIVVLAHAAQVSLGMEPIIQSMALRQCAKVLQLHDLPPDVSLHTGQRGRVTLAFKFMPEWIRLGQRIVFSQGASKGLGVIVQVHGDAPIHLPAERLLASSHSLSNSKEIDSLNNSLPS
jgi:GTPase